jgi:hypothetical protein
MDLQNPTDYQNGRQNALKENAASTNFNHLQWSKWLYEIRKQLGRGTSRSEGPRIIKRYDPPQTPYDRLMKTAYLSEVRKEKLRLLKASLDPFELKANLEKKLGEFSEELRKFKTGMSYDCAAS